MPNSPRSIVYAEGPLWLGLVMRVETVERVLANSAATINRTERALMGGWDESGTKWIEGVRDKVQHVDEKVDGMKEDVKTTKRWFWAVCGGVWAVALIALAELLNGFFGWYGSARAVLHH